MWYVGEKRRSKYFRFIRPTSLPIFKVSFSENNNYSKPGLERLGTSSLF